MKKRLQENFPQVPEHFEQRMHTMLEQMTEGQREEQVGSAGSVRLGEKLRKKRSLESRYSGRRLRTAGALSGCAAAMLVCIIGFFTAFPAYAADIPVLNRIICTISLRVEETGEGEQKVAEKTAEVLKEFMESPVVMYTGEEEQGESWQLNTDTLQSAYYFKDKIMGCLRAGKEERPEDAEIEIEVRAVQAVRKGYEIQAEVICDVYAGAEYCFSEQIEVRLIERPGMLTVVGLSETGDIPGTFGEENV